MGLIAPTSAPERNRHYLEGCMYDLDGNVMLEPTNLFDNWAFLKKNLNGDPEGIDIGMPEEPEGFYVYLTAKNQGWSTAAAQDSAPIDIDDPTWTANTVQVGGHAPRTKLSAAPISPPLQPVAELVPTTRLGFRIGTYKALYTLVDKQRRHTPLSPGLSVTVTVKGQYLIWTLPDNLTEEAYGIGLWLTRPGGNESTARLQVILTTKQVEEAGNIYTMTGPFKNGRTMPNKNQTEPAKPRKPELRRMRGISVGVAGTYKVEVAFVRDNGSESGRSPISEPVVITEAQALAGVHLAVAFGDDAQNIRKARGTYRRKDKKKEPRIDPDARYRIYITADFNDDRGEQEYVLENRNKEGGFARPFIRGESTEFSGRSRETARPGEPRVLVSLKEAGIRNVADAGAVKTITPKDEGLERPDAPLDSVVASTVTKLEPGVYGYGISYWARGEESITCVPQFINVPAGFTLLLHLPDPVNILKNAQFTHLDADDSPFGWSMAGVSGPPSSGSYLIDANGILTLTTNGPKNITTHTAPQLWSNFPVDRTQVLSVGGTISALVNTGQIGIYFGELDDAGVVKKYTLLKGIRESGQVDFSTTFGPGYTEFRDDTVTGQLLIQFDVVSPGTTRDAVAAILELFAIPHTNRVRRFETPDEPYAADNSDPPSYIRWRKVNNKLVGPPSERQRLSPSFAVMDAVDFESGTFANWTVRNSNPVPNVIAQVATLAAVDGTYGYQLTKNTGSTVYLYLTRTFTPTNRSSLASRVKYRVRRIPTAGRITIMQIKNSASDGPSQALARLTLDAAGAMHIFERNNAGVETFTRVSSGIKAGDILDLELIVQGAGTNRGVTFVAVGRNGATRSYVYASSKYMNWTNLFARTVQAGACGYTNPGSWIELDIDTIRITNAGDSLTDTFSTPSLESLSFPDRPMDVPVYLDQVDFEPNAIPSPWTTVRSPADSTTSVTVEAGAAIEGSYGLRCIDTGTGTVATACIQRTITRDDLGFKLRFQPTTLPTTGSVTVARVLDASANVLAEAYLQAVTSTSSDLYVKATSVGTSPVPVRVATGITTSSMVTAEMILLGTNSQAGLLFTWISVGGTGVRRERRLMGQPLTVDWTGRQANEVRLGIVTQSVAAVTANLRFDSIALTERGEMVFIESDADGNEVNQAYAFYPQGQPVRDDLWFRNFRRAVVPGKTYTFSLWARHAGLTYTAYPYFFTAYDLDGEPHPLGSLYGPSGATGTSDWGDAPRTQTWTIPEGCYEVRMDSPGIGAGEFCCQNFVHSPGTEAIAEVTYPESGVAWAVLDTETPLPPPEAILPVSSLENVWLSLGSIEDIPEGTEVGLEYGSSDDLIEPSLWFTDPADVEPARIAQVRATLYSDVDRKLTPVWRTGSPFVEYVTVLGGRVVPKLLREDGTEFPSGVYCTGVMFPRGISEFDYRKPKGRTRAHRKTEPIMKIPGFTMVAHSELASVEIEETCHDGPFVLEVYGRRFTFNFVDEQIEFTFTNDPPDVLNPIDGNYYVELEAQCSEIEITEIAQITRKEGVLVHG